MDTSTLRLDWLRSFVDFAETLSFTEAARRGHLSQPALHTQVRRLTEAIGTPLYGKEGRTLFLTETGREVEALARELLGRIDAFAARHDGQAVTPVISAGRATQLYLLARPLRAWGRRLSLRVDDRDACLAAVRSGRAHLGVTPITEAPAGLATTWVRDVRPVVLVPEAHPLGRETALEIRALRGLPLIVPPPGRPHRQALAVALGGGLDAALEVDGWELMAHYVSLGQGLAVVNDTIPAPPGTIAVPVIDLPVQRFHLVRRSDGGLPESVAALGAHLVIALTGG